MNSDNRIKMKNSQGNTIPIKRLLNDVAWS